MIKNMAMCTTRYSIVPDGSMLNESISTIKRIDFPFVSLVCRQECVMYKGYVCAKCFYKSMCTQHILYDPCCI